MQWMKRQKAGAEDGAASAVEDAVATDRADLA
jgi:hypothetical protein